MAYNAKAVINFLKTKLGACDGGGKEFVFAGAKAGAKSGQRAEQNKATQTSDRAGCSTGRSV